MMLVQVVLACLLLKESLGQVLSSNPSIIIVGSGPAGIAAATKLLKNNITNIKILEAENRIGGRINSVKFGDAYVDLGAESCDGEEDNIIYSIVKNLGILRPYYRGFHIFLSNGDSVKTQLDEKVLAWTQSFETTDKLPEKCENLSSMGECLTFKSKYLLAAVQDPKEKAILTQSIDSIEMYLHSLSSSFDANDLKITSDNKKCKGNHFNWNGLGFKTILEVMMQKYPTIENQLPIDDKIFLQKEVSNIYNWQTGGKVVVYTKDGGTYQADHIILTPSVGVLQANYQTLFIPSLPQNKIDAIKSIGFGGVIKVVMHFPERWWKEDASWTFVWTAEDKEKLKQKNLEWLNSASGIYQADHNPNVVITWYAGRYIPFIETLSDERILEGQTYLIDTFLRPHFNVTMPDNVIRSSWYSNPHFLGTFSYESVKGHSKGGSRFPDKLAQPLLNKHNIPTVLFAGEATHPYYFGSVHGAIETGYREAQRLIQLYRNDSVPHLL